MTDETGGRKPWDIEKYRGVRSRAEQTAEVERELVLAQSDRSDRAVPSYDRNGQSLFWLAINTSILSILTLGIYRFWMTARLRRHYWNAIRIQGDPLEYTGTGIEKILGFLVAVIILAVYLGLVNIALTFIGMSYFQGNPLALNISLFAAMPLIFFATYRARRYILARTRWRGIRFGMDQGAWGYTLRAIWLWFLTAITAGLLYPYMQFKLAKYLTDRTWFGDQKFQQNGSWGRLFAYWVWIYVALALMGLAIWGVAADPGNRSTTIIASVIIGVGYLALLIMFLRYEVVAFRYFWSNRSLGETRFESNLKPGQIIKIYMFGSLAVAVCSMIAAAILIAGVVAAGAVLGMDRLMDLMADAGPAAIFSEWRVLAVIALGYLGIIVVSFAFTQIFITRPILARRVESMVIHHPQHLTRSRQREHDHAAEAGGFADALGIDVGAGF